MEDEQDLILEEEAENEELDTSEEPVEEEPEEEEESTFEEEILDEPPIRKTAKDFIIERKNKKIEKLEKGYYDNDEDDDDDRNVIRDEVSRAVEPLANLLRSQKDEQEMQETLTKYPEAKKYEATIRKYAASPAYSQVPIDFIVKGVLGAKINSDAKKQQLNSEAKRTKNGGSVKRPKEIKEKTAWELSDDEFQKQVNSTMSGQ